MLRFKFYSSMSIKFEMLVTLSALGWALKVVMAAARSDGSLENTGQICDRNIKSLVLWGSN